MFSLKGLWESFPAEALAHFAAFTERSNVGRGYLATRNDFTGGSQRHVVTETTDLSRWG